MMIIHENEILENVQNEEKKVVLPKSMKGILLELHSMFQEGVYEYIDSNNTEGLTLNKAAELESKATSLILKTLGIYPLVDLESFGYQNVEQDSISYSFIPKNKKVGNFIVDSFVLFFKHDDNGQTINTTLPFYYVTTEDQEFLLKAEETSIENISLF